MKKLLFALAFVILLTGSVLAAGDALTCSAQEGDICGSKEVCEEDWLLARDTESCCSTRCIPDFNDAKICTNKNSKIEIKIKDPDKRDDFEIGETIKVEVEIENNFNEDLDFDVEAHLYDLDGDESIEDADDDVDINDGKDEEVELELKIPSDVEDNNFAIYVYVEDEEGRCNSAYVEIDIEREKHKVIIDEIEIPSTASPGDSVQVRVKVENLGSNDEDVVIEVENTELNIFEKTDEFELEEYDEDDKETRTILIKIPDNATEGDYEITVRAIYGSRDDSKTETIIISGKVKPQVMIAEGEIIMLDGKGEPLILTGGTSGEPLVLTEIDKSGVIRLERDPKPEVSHRVESSFVPEEEVDLNLTIDGKEKDDGKNIKGFLGNTLTLVAIIMGIVILIILIIIAIVLRR